MDNFLGQEGLHIIAGPCSAESRAQVLDTARALRRQGVSLFRAGLWKPRTRPGCFEGVGERGLEWLLGVRKECGMKVCTEVASAKHVEACLKAGLDIVWIGARTTTNPFLVQEIADSLCGTGIPVLVKNPINTDIHLWIGAVERLLGRGVERLGLVHRGFSTYEKTRYRNIPHWHIAAEMKRLFPDFPMLCDPSHMGGNRNLVEEISRRAVDLGLDGLMIESHIDPESALSDSFQQITPSELGAILKSLGERRSPLGDERFAGEVLGLRAAIDSIDEELLRTLSRRMEVSRKIGRLKKDRGVAVLQLSRWSDVLRCMEEKSRDYSLDPAFVNSLFNIIHAASIAEQNKILEKDAGKNQS